MKTLKTTLLTCTMIFVAFASISCKDAKKKESAIPISNVMNQETMNDGDSSMSVMQDEKTEAVLHDYFNLEDALVNDDNGKAKELGNNLVESLKSFDVSNYSDNEKTELNDIIEDATEHAEHIGESDIKHQREHFKILSQDR